MGVQKEDVEKFLNGNPAFAKQYFAKKMDPASLSKVSELGAKQNDFTQFQELSQVRLRYFTTSLSRKITGFNLFYCEMLYVLNKP